LQAEFKRIHNRLKIRESKIWFHILQSLISSKQH
jgi:hypothetical protein